MAAKMSKSASQKRILKELKDLAANSSKNQLLDMFEVFPDVQNGAVQTLKVLLTGTAGTPYHNGVFEVLVQYPADYPFTPPKVRVITPIYHYAVSNTGSVCLDILKDTWSPAMTVSKVLATLGLLLMDADTFDPSCNLSIRSWLSELKRVEPVEYFKNAVQHTRQHATSSSV
jgi:ubiquitin-conjugating enzyme E2 D/E